MQTTKTRLQTSPRGFYKGTLDCVTKTWRWEGVGGFYAGMWSPMMGQIFFRAISFTTFYRALNHVSEGCERPSPAQYMAAGAATGVVISFVETPIDLIKIKLQTQIFSASGRFSTARDQSPHVAPYDTVRGCVQHVVKTDGPLALWQGWRGTLLRNVPANALFFPVFEMVKRALADRRDVTVPELHTSERMLAGALAGLGFWVGPFPLDVVKARMQVCPAQTNNPPTAPDLMSRLPVHAHPFFCVCPAGEPVPLEQVPGLGRHRAPHIRRARVQGLHARPHAVHAARRAGVRRAVHHRGRHAVLPQ
jgi:solute carrier family 25 carnitine/acylcarnitine transporter 20/29